MIQFSLILLISIPFLVFSIPPKFRESPMDDDGPVDPAVLAKWEEFRNNITSTSKERSLLSCLEDQTYSAMNDFANCHTFCLLCHQGYGRCEIKGGLRLCVCDCSVFPGFDLFLPSIECPVIPTWCSRVAESTKQAQKLTKCIAECEDLGFDDAALCGADMEDPPIVRSTCTCLCP